MPGASAPVAPYAARDGADGETVVRMLAKCLRHGIGFKQLNVMETVQPVQEVVILIQLLQRRFLHVCQREALSRAFES